jgi:arsenate reductase-like glutaredoxin family protein
LRIQELVEDKKSLQRENEYLRIEIHEARKVKESFESSKKEWESKIKEQELQIEELQRLLGLKVVKVEVEMQTEGKYCESSSSSMESVIDQNDERVEIPIVAPKLLESPVSR